MTTPIQCLEESHEKLRSKVATVENAIVELRTDMKWIRWMLFIDVTTQEGASIDL